MEKLGNTELEIDANKIFECRQVTKNIINIGFSEKQKIKIIELLSLELESRDAMNILLEAVEKIKNLDNNVKFSLTTDNSDYNNNNRSKLIDV